MTPPLRREILTPSHAHALRILASALGAGLISAGLILGLTPPRTSPVPAAAVPTAEPIHVHVAIPASVTVPEPPASAQVSLVFHLGGSAYVKLADLAGEDAEAMPRHGKAVRIDDDHVYAAIAPVLERDVPLAYRTWKDRTVSVDGTCRTKVAGFAVVARLTGDPGYAGEELEVWTPATVMTHGAPVLAVRLEGCAGAGSVAGDADATTIVVPDVTEDASLAAAGKELVLASEDADAAQREWDEIGQPGAWHDNEFTAWSTQVVRHPRTGERFLSVHASHFADCGGAQINIWHLYRIGPAGELVRVSSSAGELTEIDELIDVDGDGTFEILGRTWPGGERRLVDADGETITALELPFYGCAC